MASIKKATLDKLNRDSLNLQDVIYAIEIIRGFISAGSMPREEIDRCLEVVLKIAAR